MLVSMHWVFARKSHPPKGKYLKGFNDGFRVQCSVSIGTTFNGSVFSKSAFGDSKLFY